MEEVIDLKFIGLSQGIMFTCNKQHPHIGCDYKLCGFVCLKGLTFRSIVVGGMKWSNTKDQVHNCVPFHLPNVHGQIDPSLVVIPIGLWCILCGQSTRIATMSVCDRCLKG